MMKTTERKATMLQDKIVNKTTYARKGDVVFIVKYTGQFDPVIVENPVNKERFSITAEKLKFQEDAM